MQQKSDDMYICIFLHDLYIYIHIIESVEFMLRNICFVCDRAEEVVRDMDSVKKIIACVCMSCHTSSVVHEI